MPRRPLEHLVARARDGVVREPSSSSSSFFFSSSAFSSQHRRGELRLEHPPRDGAPRDVAPPGDSIDPRRAVADAEPARPAPNREVAGSNPAAVVGVVCVRVGQTRRRRIFRRLLRLRAKTREAVAVRRVHARVGPRVHVQRDAGGAGVDRQPVRALAAGPADRPGGRHSRITQEVGGDGDEAGVDVKEGGAVDLRAAGSGGRGRHVRRRPPMLVSDLVDRRVEEFVLAGEGPHGCERPRRVGSVRDAHGARLVRAHRARELALRAGYASREEFARASPRVLRARRRPSPAPLARVCVGTLLLSARCAPPREERLRVGELVQPGDPRARVVDDPPALGVLKRVLRASAAVDARQPRARLLSDDVEVPQRAVQIRGASVDRADDAAELSQLRVGGRDEVDDAIARALVAIQRGAQRGRASGRGRRHRRAHGTAVQKKLEKVSTLLADRS